MPPILRSFSGREAEQNPPYSARRSPFPPSRVTSDECPKTTRIDSPVGDVRQNRPPSGRATTKVNRRLSLRETRRLLTVTIHRQEWVMPQALAPNRRPRLFIG